MSEEHRLVAVAREEGSAEVRFHYVCSCGALGPDHGAPSDQPGRQARAITAIKRDHQLHAEGRPVGRAKDETDLPGKPYDPEEG